GFWTLLAARALVGVGEAAYATLAPPLLSDFFSPARRNRILTYFFVAIPVGSAIGFALGGLFGKHFGWRTAFLLCGLPGVLAALVVCIGFAQFFLWFYNGPVNTVIANAVPPAMRARAFSLSILSIHLFGDAISPPIIGALSDHTGSLPLAVMIVPAAMGVGAAIWGLGWRRL